jgi:hypothetical protein
MSLARAGDQVLVRAGIPISCHRTSVPQLIVRAKGTASGDTFTASVRSRVLPRLSLDFAVQGRFSGDTAEGTVTVRGVRRKGGPRGCGIRRSATVRLRTEVSPQAAPVPAPRGASLRGLSTGTAAGVRLPVLVSVTSTGRVIARWLAQPACARGSLSVDNYTPSTREDATGRFAKAERYTVRYRDGTADHYRVRFDGRFRADGVAGTLRARVRVTGRGGRTLARCDSGLQRYGAA